MATKKISEMTTATDLTGAVIPIVQDGVNKKAPSSLFTSGGASYLVYTALLSQTGTDAPVATVLENTLGGTIVWTRNDTGFYTATLNDAFTLNKVAIFISNSVGVGIDYQYQIDDVNSISLIVATNTAGVYIQTDDCLDKTPIEIRVYP